MTAHSLCRKMLTERSGGLHTEISSFRTAACPPIKKAGCSPSASMRQTEGLHGGRISGSS